MSKNPSDLWERDDVQRARRIVRNQWPAIVLLAIAALALLTRINGWENYITANGSVQFGGNDAWYHYRQVKYTVANWPFTMPFDPWTGYPTGNAVGQFGTFFDQIIATVALIVGLGSPSDNTIRLVLLFTPPVFGMLTVFPTYYIGKKLAGERPVVGLVAALFLAMSPGTFYSRTVVGSPDHNAAEPFFLLVTISAFIAMTLALREEPLVLEMVQEAKNEGLDAIPVKPVAYSVLFGVAFGLFIWTWPPAIVFGGVILLTFVLYGFRTYAAKNAAPEPLFIGATISFIVTTLMVLPFANFNVFVPTRLGLAHFATFFALLVTTVGFIGASRLYERRDIPPWTLPLAGLFVFIIGVTGLRLVAPSVFNLIANNLINVFGLGLSGRTATISEAQSLLDTGRVVGYLLSSYGFLFGVALLGIAATLYNGLASDDNPMFIMLGVLSVAVIMMAFTQIRFNYYAAPVIAIFAAYVLDYTIQILGVPDDFPNLKGYQILVLLVLVVIVVPFIFIPVGASGSVFAPSPNADAEYESWKPTLEWMNKNTPEEGQLANPDGDTLPYYGTFEQTDDYNYPTGTYGVLSWWDYGHWITTTAERIPVANPFQQHATTAAEFLLAPTEEDAAQAMDELNAEGQTRYVVINWEMVSESSEFPAITVFHPNRSYNDYSQSVFARTGQQGNIQRVTSYRQQAYYESLMTRLYHYHGSRVPESTATFSIEQRQGAAITTQLGPQFTTFHNSTAEAEQFAAENPSEVQGGIGLFAPEPVPALEHYRLVRASEQKSTQNPRFRALLAQQSRFTGISPSGFVPYPSKVKVFERVPGATIQGTGPANETVRVRVTMQTHYGQQFVYLQEVQTGENGNFSLTVPYSTTGYDNWGPEQGYTNVSTTAATDYQLTAVTENGNETTLWTATTDVSEAKVIGEDTSAVNVTLEPQESSEDESTDDNSS